MLYYTSLFVGFFFAAWVIKAYRYVFYKLAENSVAVVNELLASTEDEVKLKSIQKSTHTLVMALLKMFLLLILALIIGITPLVIFLILSGKELKEYNLGSFYSILALSAGATLPFLIRYGKHKTADYSELSQLLHRMALNHYNIAYKLFKRECRKIKKRNLKRRRDFVIISGLARAGTTSLMNDLAKTDKFVSLNYANMPFLLCPNFWSRIYNPKKQDLKERSHKDGIMIGMNSNEALEEYFFKVKADDSYIGNTQLTEYAITEEDFSDYLDYQSIIKSDNEKIYLAKNNNFALRYQSVRSLNDDFIMVLLFRDPLTQAASLLEKHYDYRQLQEEDPFVLEYMNWLGHHEFGKNQKSFCFSNQTETIPYEKDSLNYWLQIWINYYSHTQHFKHPNTLFINYDTYCKHPKKVVSCIVEKINLNIILPELNGFTNRRQSKIDYSEELFEKALKLYNSLESNTPML